MSNHSRLRAARAAGTAVLVALCGIAAAQANPQGEKQSPGRGATPAAPGLAPFFMPSADGPAAPGPTATPGEPSMTFAWQFPDKNDLTAAAGEDGPLRKRARSYDGKTVISVPEPGALLTLGVSLAATGFGLAVGRRRRRHATEDTEEWDGSDDSVLAS